jgi:phage shock protein PspC (stress-responsive transcriptional regulator)
MVEPGAGPDNGTMSDSIFAPSPSTSRFHRFGGPLGGVASGLARTFGLSTAVVRIGLVAAAIVFGAVVVAIYVALWLVLPVDSSVPVDQRPGRPPISLLLILAVIFGLGAIFDVAMGLISLFVSVVPMTLVALGVVLVLLAWRRSAGRRHAGW